MNGINVSREKRVRQTKAIVHNSIEMRKVSFVKSWVILVARLVHLNYLISSPV